MIDRSKATALAKEAFDLWQSGQQAEALPLYEEAISLADPQHWGLSAYHGEYACVLNELGKHELATTQLERSLAAELTQGNAEGSPAVTVARYFLSDQLLRHGDLENALSTLAPSVTHAPHDWLTRVAEAQVLFALHRNSEAKISAELALLYAPSPEKAAELKRYLDKILENQTASNIERKITYK
jgi:tetratricopeptide (TPR) repeat protein